MLCTKIRLTERRFRIAQEPEHSGPIVRPCSTRVLTECITPRNTRHQRKEIPVQRTPLVVFSLDMSPETQTLAPKVTKRDPRKQPPFCQHYKAPSQCINNSNEYPEFLIRGIEINEKQKVNNNTDEIDSNTIEVPPDGPIDECTCCLEKDIVLNLDGYEMDNFGHLPGDSRTPTPMRGGMLRTVCRVARDPSPATEQVIRITMNNKGNSSTAVRRVRICDKY